MSAVLELFAPLSGVLVPLESVPDPVFAGRLVGDGISLDPLSATLLAPVAGTVTQLHKAGHAFTVTTDEGIEVLVHIGIDTVTLKGEGFAPQVSQGARVGVGEPVIVFDPDFVARRAPSLLTQVLVANGDRVQRMDVLHGSVTAGRDVVMRLTLAGDEAKARAAAGREAVLSEPVLLPNAEGLHARPAAVLVAAAKRFQAEIHLVRGAEEANAKSVVALMVLATRRNDSLRVKARGPDAVQAAETLARLLAAGCGEQPGEAPSAMSSAAAMPRADREQNTDNDRAMQGVAASPGIAVGQVVQWRRQAIAVTEDGQGADYERSRLLAAVDEAGQQIAALKAGLADSAKSQILDAHLELLKDPELLDQALAALADTPGARPAKSAAWVWREAFEGRARQLAALPNPLLRERAQDLRDVGRRVLALLAGAQQAAIVVPPNTLLIAEELTPSDTAALDRNCVVGLCTTTGGATGHVAILARSLGIPALCGVDVRALALPEGATVVLDGAAGTLHLNPTEVELSAARAAIAAQAACREQEQAAAQAPAVTADGHGIEVVANIRNAEEARAAVAAGGEGVGLLRSEFLFDQRSVPPSEDEQAVEYLAVAQALGRERPLVIRTLDVGGDKPLSYLPLPREENPFLGLRGIRVSLQRPDIFRPQLRAMLRAAAVGNVHVLFPMVATLAEWRAARMLLAEEACAMGITAKAGVMVEVPSAALLAEQLAPEVDFFSIGTNDLTQYTLAMDRGHPLLARQADALHPAVLQLIGITCAAAARHGKWVGVCGGVAGDAVAVPVLIGLGVTELSVPIPAIAAVKAQVNRLSMARCRTLAEEVLQMGTAAEVRARLNQFAQA